LNKLWEFDKADYKFDLVVKPWFTNVLGNTVQGEYNAQGECDGRYISLKTTGDITVNRIRGSKLYGQNVAIFPNGDTCVSICVNGKKVH
jgi:hypothetical protein